MASNSIPRMPSGTHPPSVTDCINDSMQPVLLSTDNTDPTPSDFVSPLLAEVTPCSTLAEVSTTPFPLSADTSFRSRKDSVIIGLDVGATTTKCCVYTQGGFIALPPPNEVSVPGLECSDLLRVDPYTYTLTTPSRHGGYHDSVPCSSPNEIQQQLVQHLVRLIHFLSARFPSRAEISVGIAFAGPVRLTDCLIESAPNIWGAGPFDLKHALQHELGTRIHAQVFADDIASGYRYYRSFKNSHPRADIHYLTISSGHSGVRIDVPGRRLIPYESGHLQVITNAAHPLYLTCGCGGVGHLETLVSGRGAEVMACKFASDPDVEGIFRRSEVSRHAPASITTRHLVSAARNGDPFSLGIIEISAQSLAKCLIAPLIASMSNPKDASIIVSGGYARAIGQRLYLASIHRAVTASRLAGIDSVKTPLLRNIIAMGFDDNCDALHGVVHLMNDRGSLV